MAGIVRRLCTNTAEKHLTSSVYHRVLSSFPEGIQMAFAYGSGVFQQQGHVDMSKNMLDFIFVVDNPIVWHRQNMQSNNKHYSFLKYLGPTNITKIQEQFAAGAYFNTLVPFEDRFIKYGVISTRRLITDLLDWDSLYVSGRLHKPVKFLVTPTDSDLLKAMQINLQSATHAALLILPETFTEEELYITITGLSYHGDFRMKVGEDKNKISNIVKPNMPFFRQMYHTFLENEEHLFWDKNKSLEQYPSYVTQFHHLNLLSKAVQMELLTLKYKGGIYPDMEEVLRQYAHDSACGEHVAKCISSIVWNSSLNQSLKSLFTAGVGKSARYSAAKLKKMFKS
ncbi:phosphatidate cytidylyltransferase, mitochondrial-like [Gigantopelta aegis]|uniref:phosphatidate cytidylyltransferase, mitochondrial-like n=1 Tax=Gigantopelta aegis TaxID=1735272 RepID=UPI001B88DB73|nr:phosphatidate cytidylyltransferase, mitochondrial-like [Gigantopelta aegis]